MARQARHYFVALASSRHIYGGEQNAISGESAIRTSFVLERFQSLTGTLCDKDSSGSLYRHDTRGRLESVDLEVRLPAICMNG
jgi:hypothetical protein